MRFDELDKRMRQYEESLDQVILPELYMVARLDGRSFTRLTKEVCRFEAPFDERFRDGMLAAVRRLADCGFRVIYGYTQSDEISLLFHPEENTFGRKVRKYNSILAGEASAALSLELGLPAVTDCRMIPLPTAERVQDYFLWRQEDAARNALNAHCYWMLRKEGLTVQQATEQVAGKTVSEKNELLFSRGINFDKLPLWQKRGVGLYWRGTEKQGFDPVRGQKTTAVRRRLYCDMELPRGEQYAAFIAGLLQEK